MSARTLRREPEHPDKSAAIEQRLARAAAVRQYKRRIGATPTHLAVDPYATAGGTMVEYREMKRGGTK